jgi:NTE family protein
MLTPSEDLRAIAARHAAAMPPGLRGLLSVTGARNGGGSQLASYLMFESAFTRELMELGYHDAKQLSGVLRDFIGGAPLPPRPPGL